MLSRGHAPWDFGEAGWSATALLQPRWGAFFARAAFAFFHFTQPRYFPAAAALGLFRQGGEYTVELGAPTRDASGSVSAVTMRMPEALAALALQWEFWYHVISTDNRNSQTSLSGCNFDTYGPRATKWVGRAVIGVDLVAMAESHLLDSLDSIVQGFGVLPEDAPRYTPTQGLYQKSQKRSCGSVRVWKLTPYCPSRDRSALTAAPKLSAVDGTTINFSHFSWAVRPPGQDARNQARKGRVSLIPEIKMSFLLGRSSAGKKVLAT